MCIRDRFKAYAPVTKEKLWETLKYFLAALMPTCRECDIKMAIHMDDPPCDLSLIHILLPFFPALLHALCGDTLFYQKSGEHRGNTCLLYTSRCV